MDVSGETGNWHVRFHAQLLPYVIPEIEKFSKYVIGALEHGKDGTPHYHCWFVWNRTKASVTKVFQRITKMANIQTSKGRGNGAYAAFAWDENVGYIIKAGVHSSKGFDSFPTPSSSAPIVVDVSGVVQYRIQKPKRSVKMTVVFAEYLEKECKWEKECITMDNLADKKEDMIDCLTLCFNNAFGTDAQARNALDYAAFVFGDEEVVAHLQKKNVEYYKKLLRW